MATEMSNGYRITTVLNAAERVTGHRGNWSVATRAFTPITGIATKREALKVAANLARAERAQNRRMAAAKVQLDAMPAAERAAVLAEANRTERPAYEILEARVAPRPFNGTPTTASALAHRDDLYADGRSNLAAALDGLAAATERERRAVARHAPADQAPAIMAGAAVDPRHPRHPFVAATVRVDGSAARTRCNLLSPVWHVLWAVDDQPADLLAAEVRSIPRAVNA